MRLLVCLSERLAGVREMSVVRGLVLTRLRRVCGRLIRAVCRPIVRRVDAHFNDLLRAHLEPVAHAQEETDRLLLAFLKSAHLGNPPRGESWVQQGDRPAAGPRNAA
jgi:hypothetical protein